MWTIKGSYDTTTINYTNGIRNGAYTYNYENGSTVITETGSYLNDERDGVWESNRYGHVISTFSNFIYLFFV